MLKKWKSLAYTTKFSISAFLLTSVLGLFSMGLLGMLLYYLVSFLFSAYPGSNDWRGDWVWGATIAVGMLWSFGFLFGGLSWHYLRKLINSVLLLRIFYGAILWLWAAVLWYIVISKNLN